MTIAGVAVLSAFAIGAACLGSACGLSVGCVASTILGGPCSESDKRWMAALALAGIVLTAPGYAIYGG